MDSKRREACDVQMTLANKGFTFSAEEIQEIMEVLSGVSLKLIITNVPLEVFKYDVAQIYMNRPEAALLARLETQGWMLPEHVYANIPNSSVNSNSGGINCYIGNFEDSNDKNEINQEEEFDYCDNPECTVDSDEYFGDDRTEDCKENTDFQSTSLANNKLLNQDVEENSAEFIASSVSPIVNSSRNFRSQKEMSPDRTISEFKNISNTSGEKNIDAPVFSNEVCKHGKYKRRSLGCSTKHLAPPKPCRLFLLSPPASPPVGWEPKPECEPVINYELLHALASLAPGEAFELHPRDQANRHPSIVITPCETGLTYDKDVKKLRIVQTKCPDRKC
ncbi:unnamed protein product [Schistosoma mattheei]|uniref:Uncharacterized protein n=1 Tax=Schistosoma mattheei TaxID=31246 RepID=A0A183PAD2_9TREM|nr:unnamed protein product [Schistosoma mattheei]